MSFLFVEFSCKRAHIHPYAPFRRLISSAAVLLLSTTFLTSCIGSPSGPGTHDLSSQVHVTISPASANISPGGSLQFTALVTGTNQTTVNWSSTVGTISPNGLLQVPATASTKQLTVTATSGADDSQHASANITVSSSVSALSISTSTLPKSVLGLAYNTAMNATGGQSPYQWSIVSGTLPPEINLNSANGVLSGSPSAVGTFSFVTEVSDQNHATAQQTLAITVATNSSTVPCTAPTYPCARIDASIARIGNLPAWGSQTGANKIFYDKSFNAAFPPKYVRVTDANTGNVLGLTNGWFAVSAGSGDDAHFNADDSLFTLTGQDADWYVFGLNPTTMQTGLVFATTNAANVIWSQTNPNYFYSVGDGGVLQRYDFSDIAHCRLGGTNCSPGISTVYNFQTSCNEPSGARLWVNAGIGGGDVWFAAASGQQDIDNRVYAYNATTQTCYFYNTRFGTVHSFDASHQNSITGNLSCDGQTASVTGTNFDPQGGWRGLNVTLTSGDGSSTSTYQVAHVTDSSHMQLGYACSPAGKYTYSIKPGTPLGAISAGENFSVHDIRMDPGGKWLIVEEGSYCYDQNGMSSTGSNCNVIHAWQLGTSTVNSCPWVAGQPDTSGACSGHYTENAGGWINDAEFGNSNNPSMQYRDWDDLATNAGGYGTAVLELNSGNLDLSSLSFFGEHPTNKNDALGTHSYPVFSSTYAGESGIAQISTPYSNEVVAWNRSAGPVMRFGHTFNSALEPHSQFSAWIAVGAVSSTGKFYLFTTDGEGTLGNVDGSSACSVAAGNCRSDVFLLSLTPPAAN